MVVHQGSLKKRNFALTWGIQPREEDVMLKSKNVINCGDVPVVPQGLKIKEYVKGGILIWDPTMISPFLFEEQKRTGGIVGTRLLESHPLNSIPVVPGSVFDFLLKNSQQIRGEWDGLVFLDPIFEAYDGSLHVRQLIREIGGQYHASMLWLDVSMCEIHPIAMFKETA